MELDIRSIELHMEVDQAEMKMVDATRHHMVLIFGIEEIYMYQTVLEDAHKFARLANELVYPIIFDDGLR